MPDFKLKLYLNNMFKKLGNFSTPLNSFVAGEKLCTSIFIPLFLISKHKNCTWKILNRLSGLFYCAPILWAANSNITKKYPWNCWKILWHLVLVPPSPIPSTCPLQNFQEMSLCLLRSKLNNFCCLSADWNNWLISLPNKSTFGQSF